jgi:hypothetical protein
MASPTIDYDALEKQVKEGSPQPSDGDQQQPAEQQPQAAPAIDYDALEKSVKKQFPTPAKPPQTQQQQQQQQQQQGEDPLAPLGKFLTHFKDSAVALATALNPEQVTEDEQGNVQIPPGWHPEAHSLGERLMALADDLPVVHQINQLRKGQVAEMLGDLAPTLGTKLPPETVPAVGTAAKGAVKGAAKAALQPSTYTLPGMGLLLGHTRAAEIAAIPSALKVGAAAVRGAKSALTKRAVDLATEPPPTPPNPASPSLKPVLPFSREFWHYGKATPTFWGGKSLPEVPGAAAPAQAAAPAAPVEPVTPQVSLDDIALGQTGKKFARLSPDDQASVRDLFQRINKVPAGNAAPAATPAPQTARPAQSPPFLPALDRVEMNRMLHAKAQQLNLPGSPPGVRAPGFLGGLAREHFQKPYESLNLDQMKQLYNLLDTKAIPENQRRGGMVRLAHGGSVTSSVSYNGISDPSNFRTSLSPDEEAGFQSWLKANRSVPAIREWRDTPRSDYDMRGFFQALQAGDPRAITGVSPFDRQIHFTDTWKTPYHRTFSNESIYASPDAPHWVGDRLIDKTGRVVADETPVTKARGGAVNDKRHPEVERLMRERMPMIGIHLILGIAKPQGKR